jgi:hypothetical protein
MFFPCSRLHVFRASGHASAHVIRHADTFIACDAHGLSVFDLLPYRRQDHAVTLCVFDLLEGGNANLPARCMTGSFATEPTSLPGPFRPVPGSSKSVAIGGKADMTPTSRDLAVWTQRRHRQSASQAIDSGGKLRE